MFRILIAAAFTVCVAFAASAGTHAAAIDQLKAQLSNSHVMRGIDGDMERLNDYELIKVNEIVHGDDNATVKRNKIKRVFESN